MLNDDDIPLTASASPSDPGGPSKRKHEDPDFDAKLERLKEAAGAQTKTDLARALGIKIQAVSPPIEERRIPSDWVLRISAKYSVSSDWILYGIGSKVIGGLATDDQPSQPVVSAPAAPEMPPLDPTGYAIANAMAAAARVLASGTSYANVLLYNIQHLDRAVADAKKIPALEQRVAELHHALALLQNEMMAIKEEYCRHVVNTEDLENSELPEICRPLARAG